MEPRTKERYRSDYRVIEWYADQYDLDLTSPEWSIVFVEQRREDGAAGATIKRNLEGAKYHGLSVLPLAVRRAEHFTDDDSPRRVDGIGLRVWCEYVLESNHLTDPRTRTIVRAIVYDGYTSKQVSALIGVSEWTVRNILIADGRPPGIRVDDIRRWGKARELYGYFGERSITLGQIDRAITALEDT